MKKLFWGRACGAMAAILLSVCLCACGRSDLEKYGDKISELREHLFSAACAECSVTAIAGKREDPYRMDGVSGDKRDFTVITVTPTAFASDKTYRYRTEINGVTYEGDLLPHPFAQSLSVDIPVAAQEGFALTVSGDGEWQLQVERVVTGELIGAEKALSIALDKLKDNLRPLKNKGKLNAEVYVRLLENPIDGSGGYYWYVAFVGEDKVTVAVLLRGDTGEVSALRV